MIVVDSSAILAILLKENDASVYAKVLNFADTVTISTAAILECSIKAQRRLEGQLDEILDEMIERLPFVVVPFDAEQLAVARQAFGQYGKGMRHPAQLNFGDCISYALAKTQNAPLLFKGNDFSHTDITSALS